MKTLFLSFLFLIIISTVCYSQTWQEKSGVNVYEYTVISKEQYDRFVKQYIEDGALCDIEYIDIFYINDNMVISGIRPKFNGYYYLSGTLTSVVGRSRFLAYGNGNTGRLIIKLAWFHNIEMGSSEFYTLYNRYIRRVNGE